MPAPYIFQSRSSLIKALRAPRTLEMANQFFAKRSDTIASIVNEGVRGNTFRAFRKLPVKPSVAFREWTTLHIEHTLRNLLAIGCTTDYAQYVHDMTLALNLHWQTTTQSEMGYGRGAKLLNLVLKKLACFRAVPDERRSALITLMHVPFDSYTLVGLRIVAPELRIPANATMKHITSPGEYAAFQAFISEVADEATVPPIYYDILAWDLAH